jgi:hypothetical protein
MRTIPFVDKTYLVALIQDPATTRHAWANCAVCITLPTGDNPYFPEDDDVPSAEALACCAVCPVATECLASALVHEALDGCRFGWWGGVAPNERDLLWGTFDLPARQPVEVDLRNPAAIARHLRAQRLTVSAIAAELGCTERTVYRYLAASAA